jgi:V8-like Glu-specific endopeptidase
VLRLALSALAFLLLIAHGHSDNPQLDPAVLKAVKKATVYLRVTFPDGRVVQGSGFFAVEPNIVLTNAHVLGMLRPESRQPKKLEIIANSGEKDEKTYTGEVAGVDRLSDLAVIRVEGKDVPQPLKISSAKDLQETQEVLVVGFPFGADLGKNITISKSSVSSLRKNANGIIQQIQINGGMHPGNSGGPVVDGKGQVVGVAVAGVRNTQIHFAVPADYVHTILNGRMLSLVQGYPYIEDGKVKVDVTLQLLDPLRRVKKVSLDNWAGDPGKPRLGSTTEPKGVPGDGPRQTLALKYENGTAAGVLVLPDLAGDKVSWTRPVFVDGAGSTKWAAASGHKVQPPVERKPVILTFKHHPGSKTDLELSSRGTLKLRDADDRDHPFSLTLVATLEETTAKDVDAKGTARIKLGYKKFEVGINLDNQPLPRSKVLEKITGDVRFLAADLAVDRHGTVIEAKPDLSQVPKSSREALGDISDQVLESLEAIAVPLPGEEVTVDKPWKAQRRLLISSVGPPEPGVVAMTYTYLGTRKVSGRAEALVRINGTIRGRKGEGYNMGGRASGMAVVDLQSGQVANASLTIDIDMDIGQDKTATKISGTLDVSLQRKISAPGGN